MAYEYRGYTGTIIIVGDDLYLIHHGMAANVAGLATGQHRKIPLAQITDVRFKPATALVNGFIILGLTGRRMDRPHVNNPDGVSFRRKDNTHFSVLYNWLVHVVNVNRSKPPNAASVTEEPAHGSHTAQGQASVQRQSRKEQEHDQDLRELKEKIRHLEVERAQLQEELARAKEIDVVPKADAAPAPIPVSRVERRSPATPELAELTASARLLRLDPLEEQIEVAGETYHIRDIKRVFTDASMTVTTQGVTLDDLECVYVPEPWNPHDPNAVAVMIGRHHVGYIPADLAEDYSAPLRRMAAEGILLTGTARIWAREQGGMARARVTVLAPAADTLTA